MAASVAAGTESIHRASLTLLLRAPTREALDALDGRVRDRLVAAGAQMAGCRWEQLVANEFTVFLRP